MKQYKVTIINGDLLGTECAAYAIAVCDEEAD